MEEDLDRNLLITLAWLAEKIMDVDVTREFWANVSQRTHLPAALFHTRERHMWHGHGGIRDGKRQSVMEAIHKMIANHNIEWLNWLPYDAPGKSACVLRLRSPAVVVVVIRGSFSVSDWIRTDADAIHFTSRGVARGLDNAYDAMRDGLRMEYEKHATERVLFVGHSLGGALAACAVDDIRQASPDATPELVTFGAPRLFTAEFQARMSDDGTQLEMSQDVVPRIPPWGYNALATTYMLRREVRGGDEVVTITMVPASDLGALTHLPKPDAHNSYASAIRRVAHVKQLPLFAEPLGRPVKKLRSQLMQAITSR